MIELNVSNEAMQKALISQSSPPMEELQAGTTDGDVAELALPTTTHISNGEPLAPLEEYIRAQAPSGLGCQALYTYTELDGTPAYLVGRKPKPEKWKTFQPDGTLGLNGRPKNLPYRLHFLRDAEAREVYITEGEKDALALEWAGQLATTAGGAGSWGDVHSKALKDAGVWSVVLFGDNDDAGRKDRDAKVLSLSKFFPDSAIRVVEAAKGKDAHDHLSAALSVGQAAPVAPVVPLAPAPKAPTPTGDVSMKILWTWFGKALDKVEELGSRDKACHWLGQQLRDHNLPLEVALEMFAPIFVTSVPQPPDNPFTLAEANNAIRSAYRQDQRDPALLTEDEELQKALERERLRRAVKRILDEEEVAKDISFPEGRLSLAEDLAADIPIPKALVGGLHFQGGNTLLSAKFKAGKTTLYLNLLKSLADGEPFLREFSVERPSGRIGYWNYEVSEAKFLEWVRTMGIASADRVSLLHLRGKRVPLTSPQGQDRAVRWLEEHEVSVWMLDPFARAFLGDENSNTEVGRFLEALDTIKDRAGVQDLLLSTHFGRSGDRTRGASRLDDWGDHLWKYTMDDDEDADATRHLEAIGRDVDVQRTPIMFDHATLSLRVGREAQSGAGSGLSKTMRKILMAVEADDGITSGALETVVGGNRATYLKAAAAAAKEGFLEVEKKGNSPAKYHHITEEGKAVLHATSKIEVA